MKAMLLLLLSPFCFGQALITSPAVIYADAPAGASYLVDNLATAPVSVYSLRKLRATYTGSAVRVRRSSDNTEQDIGFSGNGLDQSALLAFVGSGSAYVRTWYDQKGTSDLTQTSGDNQPRIVNAGTLITANSLPTVEAQAGSSYMDAAVSLTNTTLAAVFVTLMRPGTTNYGRLLSVANGGQPDYDMASTANVLSRDATNNGVAQYRNNAQPATATITVNQLITTASLYDGMMGRIYVNGSQSGMGVSMGNFNANLMRLFRHTAGAGEAWDGVCSEMLVFTATPPAADLATIQTSQKGYFGTP